MKRYLLILFFVSFSSLLFSQGGEIKGTIKDAASGETVVGASVLIGDGKGVVTDINGNYSIKIDSFGQYTLTVSYVGFTSQKLKVKVSNKTIVANFSLETTTLSEVEVVADVAKIRETPVAFSTISSKQIKEELGTRDLPMILNSTPGVYATQQGGGSGDARINIRGFDQKNIAVMVDGVPVNDMETGQVFWSNWDGLGDITQTLQVQRGLGASKLAIPSVGGTINIITKGIDQKLAVNIKQEVNDYGLYKTSFGFNSGQLKKGWGITLGGSRKWGSEWADATYTDAWSYYGKIQKRFKKQLFSFSASGAPQSHGQRTTQLPIAIYSRKMAEGLGINVDSTYQYMGTHTPSYYTTAAQGERGLKYNANWGYLNGDVFNEKINYFHKPQFNLTHLWTPNDRLNVSTVLYLSVGHGGGTAMKNTAGRDSTNGQLDIQSIYDHNSTTYSPSYSTTEFASSNYLRSAHNDHIWYGVLSSWNYKVNKNISTLFGVDARYYKGSHYQSVYNLIGGDYAIDNSDKNQPVGFGNTQYSIKKVGDKVSYYNDSKVMWGGLFGQAEYKKDKWSTFVTASVSETGYQRIDHFKKKDLVIDGQTYEQAVGFGDVFYTNGSENVTAVTGANVYNNGDTTFITNPGKPVVSILNATSYTNTSAGSRVSTTKQKWFLGYTIKGGANYNIDDFHNVFVNFGYLNMAPRMNAVFDNNNKQFLSIENQKVSAIEAGYGLHNRQFAVNVNLYYTLWKNKPPLTTPSVVTPDGTFSYNINGLDALHKGIEIDLFYKILKNLDFDGLISIGDWKTISGTTVYVTDNNNVTVATVDFSAKNVHVGDAAQEQFVGSLRYTIIKNLYIKPRYTYYAKNYANFDPIALVGVNKDRESWKMPNYGLLDIYLGYDFNYSKLKFGVTAGVLNALNTTYITDGFNGINFDATTTNVFMGMGRRFNIALRIGF
jgi:iron complex outermembrane receptor protein